MGISKTLRTIKIKLKVVNKTSLELVNKTSIAIIKSLNPVNPFPVFVLFCFFTYYVVLRSSDFSVININNVYLRRVQFFCIFQF